MTTPTHIHRMFGTTGIAVPPIAFRDDVLDNSVRVIPDKTKRLICGEWLRRVNPPIFIDVVLNEKRSLHLNALGRVLTHFDVTPEEVVINFELEACGESRNSAELHPIRTQFGKACDLLGKNHSPRFVTLRVAMDDDAPTAPTFRAPLPDVVDSLHDLEVLKTQHQLAAVGIALHDWRLGQAILDVAHVDFIKLLSGPTVLRHPPEMLKWLADLAARSIPVITAGVFHGGFLIGGPTFGGRMVHPDAPTDRSFITWRKAFTALCHGHGVRPTHACIQFALVMAGVTAVSLSTSHVDRVAEDVFAATTPVPSGLWASMKEEGLLASDYGDARA